MSNMAFHLLRRARPAGTQIAICLLLAGLAVSTSRADILFAAYYGNGEIHKFTSGGADSVFAHTYGPVGLAFDRAGNLYAANAGISTIVRFTPGGVGSLFANSGLNGPQGLAFDRAGNLYVANARDHTIAKFTPGGVGSVFANSGGTTPVGLAFDSAGNLYAANEGGSIAKFTPGGVGSVFAITGGSTNPEFLAFTDDAGMPLPLANQVPEPAGLSILALTVPVLLRRRKRVTTHL